MLFKKILHLSTLVILISALSCESRVHFITIDSFDKSFIVDEDTKGSSTYSKESIGHYSSLSESTYHNNSSTSSEMLIINKNDLNYFFITDLHIDTDDELNQCTALLTKIVEYANDNDFLDFICIGGDLTTLYFESKQEWIEWNQRILAPLKKCHKPIFVLNGNHDDNSNCSLDHLDTNNLIFQEWNEHVMDYVINVGIEHDKEYLDSKYYYYDFSKGKKAYRIVCLNSNDRPESLNNMAYWGFSKKQIEWLDSQVFTNKNREYVILSHMPIDWKYNIDKRHIEYNDELINCLETKRDFCILVNSFGHCHLNLLSKFSFGLPCTCTTTLLYGGREGYDGQSLFGELNNLDLGWETVKKNNKGYSFNLFSINENQIERIAFGDGDDAKLFLDKQ